MPSAATLCGGAEAEACMTPLGPCPSFARMGWRYCWSWCGGARGRLELRATWAIAYVLIVRKGMVEREEDFAVVRQNDAELNDSQVSCDCDDGGRVVSGRPRCCRQDLLRRVHLMVAEGALSLRSLFFANLFAHNGAGTESGRRRESEEPKRRR